MLSIKTEKTNSAAQIELTDTGCGIPEENITEIFNPFFTTKESGKGTGLGLSICRKIIQEHGGTIQVTSRVENGTSFTIKLPLAKHIQKI
ncbi:MAG: HAMP domain-containing histidine kinase [wastewater metagenome]|nr:HAMP domain-containing histidine kinase [Candidatus Loosdrechtia aerotolerans]